MPYEPDWSKILCHSASTAQLKAYHQQLSIYLVEYKTPIFILDPATVGDKPDPSRPPEDDEVPEECPKCGEKLIMKGKGWGFCDNCVCEIEVIKDNKED